MSAALDAAIEQTYHIMQRARREHKAEWARECRTVLWELLDIRREGLGR